MVRSPRSQRVLLAVFAVLIVVSSIAFAATATAQLAWQERDTIDIEPTDYRLEDGQEPTVAISMTVSNPTGAAVEVQPSSVTVYDGRVGDETQLSVPRSAQSSQGSQTVPAGETGTVTVVADVRPDRFDRTDATIDSGDALVSGTFRITIGERSDYVDI